MLMGRLRVFYGYPGSPSLLRRYAELLQKDSLFLVTTSPRRQALEQKLLLRGTVEGIVGERFLTLDEFAERVFSQLPGRRLAGDRIRRLIISRILTEDPVYPSLPGVIEGILNFIDLVKQNGIRDAGELGERLKFLKDERSQKLPAVFGDYNRLLRELHYADLQDAYFEAVGLIAEDRVSLPKTVVLDGFYSFSPLQKEFLRTLIQNSEEALAVVYFNPDHLIPDRVFEVEDAITFYRSFSPEVELEEGGFTEIRTRLFRRPSPSEKIKEPGKVHLLRFSSRAGEVDGIMRRVKKLLLEGVPPERICVGFYELGRYASLLQASVLRFGIPAEIYLFRPLSEFAPARALRLLLEARLRNFRRQELIAFLSCQTVNFREEDEILDPDFLDLCATHAWISGRGIGEWQNKLTELHDQLKEPQEDDELPPIPVNKLEKQKALLSSALVELDELEDEMTPGDFICTILHLLERFRISEATPDKEDPSLIKLRELLSLLPEVLDEKKLPLSQLSDLLRVLLERERLLRPSERGVKILDLLSLRDMDFDYLFFGGMVEGEFPAYDTTLTFISDEELRKANLQKPLDRYAESRYLFYQLFLIPSRELCLTYPAQDPRNPHLVRSSFLSELDLIAEIETRDVEEERDYLSFADMRRSWSATLNFTLDPPPLALQRELVEPMKAVLNSFRIYLLRTTGRGAYAGELDGEPARIIAREFDPRRRIYSPTLLSLYGLCPFRFFVQRVLQFEEGEEPPEDILPRVRGSLLHRILYRFCSETGGAGEREKLHSIALDELRKTRLTSGVLADAFKELLLSVLDRFLDWNKKGKLKDGKPEYLEWYFGGEPRGEAHRRSTTRPLLLRTNPPVRLQGKIDRIDFQPDGSAIVIDYKTGRAPGPADMLRGLDFQLQIYIMAVRELLKHEVKTAYFFKLPFHEKPQLGGIKPKGHTQEQVLVSALEYMPQYASGIAKGVFTPRGQSCRQCPCAELCRREEFRNGVDNSAEASS